MRKALLFSALLFTASCKQPTKAEQPDSRTSPRVGRIEAVWEVQDKETGERVGFVERYRYDDGRMIYWVKNQSRRVKRGYILPNNNAYRYVWIGGKRSDDATFIGADTIAANSRRILGYSQPVQLEQTSLEALKAEHAAAAPAEQPADAGETEEDEE